MQHSRDDLVVLLPHLRAFARSLTGGDRHLADDLVQDTVMLALRGWGQFTPGTNLKSWLFKILHNRFSSHTRRKHVTSEIGDEALMERHSVPAAQESALEVTAFKRAFAELNPVHRTVLVLCVVQGLPYEEVAAICGCEVGTVKSRISRARITLKRKLLGEEASGKMPAAGSLSCVGPASLPADTPTPATAAPAHATPAGPRRGSSPSA